MGRKILSERYWERDREFKTGEMEAEREKKEGREIEAKRDGMREREREVGERESVTERERESNGGQEINKGMQGRERKR